LENESTYVELVVLTDIVIIIRKPSIAVTNVPIIVPLAVCMIKRPILVYKIIIEVQHKEN